MLPFLIIWYLFLKHRLEASEKRNKTSFDPLEHWSQLERQVTVAVERYGYECERLEYFVKEEYDYKQNFDKMWQSCGCECPLLLFHGTLESNLAGIREKGLVVPSSENGVAVRNGSLHGVGIYLTNANGVMTSLGYCDRSKLIICAVIPSPHEEFLMNRSDIYVAFNSALVLPCFLVHLRYVGPRFQTYNPVKDYNPIAAGTSVETNGHQRDHIYTFSSRTIYLVSALLIFLVLLLLRNQGYPIPALDLLQYIGTNVLHFLELVMTVILTCVRASTSLEGSGKTGDWTGGVRDLQFRNVSMCYQ